MWRTGVSAFARNFLPIFEDIGAGAAAQSTNIATNGRPIQVAQLTPRREISRDERAKAVRGVASNLALTPGRPATWACRNFSWF
jgi:hypothetical protein